MLRKHTLLEDFNSTKLLSIPLISEAYPYVPFKSQAPVYGIHHNTDSLSGGSSKPSIVSLRKRDTGGLSESIKHFINRGKHPTDDLKGIRQLMKESPGESSNKPSPGKSSSKPSRGIGKYLLGLGIAGAGTGAGAYTLRDKIAGLLAGHDDEVDNV